MKVEKKVLDHFEKLREQYKSLLKTKKRATKISKSMFGQQVEAPSFIFVDQPQSYQWGTSCLYFLNNIFGENSEHYIHFKELFPKFKSNANFHTVELCWSILKSAKADYEDRGVFDSRALIEAEVFAEFLEQAEELSKKGYYQPAAVIAGCVLEDGLRKLCKRNGITVIVQGTKSISIDDAAIDSMNTEIAKSGIYTKLTQKKITSLAELRNKAAHGKWTEFNKKDVEDMIRDVRRFMEDYFT